MISIRRFALIAAAMVAMLGLRVAPAHADAPKAGPAAGDSVSDADAQRFFAFFDKFVSIVVANQNDCAKMAAGINAHIDANQALIKDVADAKAHNKQLPADIKAKIEKKITNELQPALQKCAQDKTVQAALMRMDSRQPPPQKEAPKK